MLKAFLTFRYLWQTVLVAGAYILSAKLGLYTASPSIGGNVTLIWPATGIAFAAVVFFGYRVWPALIIGAFVANIFNDAPLSFAVISAIGNPLPAIVGYHLLTQLTSFDKSLNRISDVCWFVAIPALATTTLSATIGSLGLENAGLINWSDYLGIWFTWWLGDSMGVLLIAPAILTSTKWFQNPWAQVNRTELFFFFLSLSLACITFFTDFFGYTHGSKISADEAFYYFIFIFVIWAALRIRQHGTTIAILMISVFAILGAVDGHGPFLANDISVTLFKMHMFLASMAIVAMLSAAEVEQRKQIEDQKMIEEQLIKNEERLRQAQQIVGLGYFERDLISESLFWSDEMFEIFGVTGERPKLSNKLFLEFVHPDDREKVIHAIQKTLKKIKAQETEFRIIRPDGVVRHVFTVRKSLREESGRPTKIMGTMVDVTDEKLAKDALKESEEQFRNTFEGSHVGMTITGTDGQFLRTNQAFRDFVGYNQAELSNITFKDITHPDDLQISLEDRSSLLKKEVKSQDVEKRYITKDGKEVWGRLNRSLVTNADGSPKYVVGQIQNITQQKASEEQLRQSQKMEAVGQLTGGIAHDFNNMLSAISGNIELAQSNSNSPDNSKRLQSALKTVRRAAALTHRLLAYSRQQTLEPVPVNAEELVVDLLGLLHSSLGETIEIKTKFEADLADINIDKHQLENAILNLSINARDAMPGGGVITISARNLTVDEAFTDQHSFAKLGNYVSLSIADTGFGISDGDLNKVFDPFFTTKDVGKGSGLGLSMVYGFVKQSDGFVTIDSKVDGGTSIALNFPRQEQENVPAQENDQEKKKHRGNGERVLVIEDDPDVRDITISMLDELGYAVIDGGDGSQAASIASGQDHPIDLLIADVTLPNGVNGSEIARAIQAENQGLKILLVSGYAQKSLKKEDPDDQPLPLLQKPFGMNILAQKVQEIINGAES